MIDETNKPEEKKRRRPTRPPLPRRISPEVAKAETALLRLQVDAEASVLATQTRWAEKRAALLRAIPHDVLAMLVSGGIITTDDLEDLQSGGTWLAPSLGAHEGGEP